MTVIIPHKVHGHYFGYNTAVVLQHKALLGMKYWKKLSHAELDKRITEALEENINYKQRSSLGIPASRLDPNVFNDSVSFLKEAPLLRCYVQNPNHIGCHTEGDSESFFRGTQKLEREIIELLSVDLLQGQDAGFDGYIASGGTECNIQAVWMYRNRFIREYQAAYQEIGILCSEDTHYSITKAANMLNLALFQVPVRESDRTIESDSLLTAIQAAKASGIKYFIVIANMGTTMFGSVDDVDLYVSALQQSGMGFSLHIDGAFGGFVFPVISYNSSASLKNPYVSSITLDAHKMLQAPYGTGIFIARKNLMDYVITKEASYVNGMDITLSGSRSGTNAVAVWMILFTYGSFGWLEKINKLMYRTDWCCRQLEKADIPFYRHPKMNIITIPSSYISEDVAERFGLVPDSHGDNKKWYKVVVMDHVELDNLKEFISDLKDTHLQSA
jgi:tyrosine decarboxylase / aspartate 1-decarboxylase